MKSGVLEKTTINIAPRVRQPLITAMTSLYMLNDSQIEPNDIVKITGKCSEQGRYAKVLRVTKGAFSKTWATLNVQRK
jgi:hypothetical protein